MSVITSEVQNFIPAAEIYAKIRRQWQSFDSVNVLDETEFPNYTAEVLNQLGNGGMKEEQAVLTVKNNKAQLPEDFKRLHAAYKCSGCNITTTRKHLQGKQIFENNVTKSLYHRRNGCDIKCDCKDELIEKITICHYVNDYTDNYTYNNVSLLRLSPNVRQYCDDLCININCSSADEITINNNHIFTNFEDGDIYMQYYAFPFDEDGMPMVPDEQSIKEAVEWYIKWQVMLNAWLVDDLQNVQNKWQKAEQMYRQALAKARFHKRLPSFNHLVNAIRTKRAVNQVSLFNQIDKKNPNRY